MTELATDPVNGWLGVIVLIVASVTWLSGRVLMVMYDVFAINVVDLLVVESFVARGGLVIATLYANNVWEIPRGDV